MLQEILFIDGNFGYLLIRTKILLVDHFKSGVKSYFLFHIYFQNKVGYPDELMNWLSHWALITNSNRSTQKLMANFTTRLHTWKNEGCAWFSNSLGFTFNLSLINNKTYTHLQC